MSKWEGKKASSFAIFSIANVLAFVQLLATISANLVICYSAVVANVSDHVATLPEQETTFTSVVTTLQVLVATLPELITTLQVLVTT